MRCPLCWHAPVDGFLPPNVGVDGVKERAREWDELDIRLELIRVEPFVEEAPPVVEDSPYNLPAEGCR